MVRYSEIVEDDQDHLYKLIKRNFWIRSPEDYSINPEGKVDFKCDVNLRIARMSRFPFAFGSIVGNFSCGECGLISLRDGPSFVRGAYICRSNELTSLEGSPRRVDGVFDCGYNGLTSLVGAPTDVGGNFICDGNILTSLEGLPKRIGKHIIISWNEDLPLLRLVGRFVEFKSTDMSGHPLSKIINQYVGDASRANIITCQKELIDAGFEGNASW